MSEKSCAVEATAGRLLTQSDGVSPITSEKYAAMWSKLSSPP
jgi:hypothetical protein